MKNMVHSPEQSGIITWENGSGNDVASGDEFLIDSATGNILVVAAVDIADGDTGAVYCLGTFNLPATAAAIEPGTILQHNGTALLAVTDADLHGVAICTKGKALNATEVEAMLMPGVTVHASGA